MGDQEQSQGRNDNDAIPESEAVGADKKDNAAAEHAKDKPDYGSIPAPNDFEGPAGDPVEGAR